MLAAAAIGAAGSYFAGRAAASATKKAAKQQAAALRYAADIQKKMYETGREDLAPYRGVGPEALGYLTTAAGAESPLYQLQLEESEKGINRYLASRGQFGSGAAGQLLSENARRVAAEEAQARWGRNLSLADIGQRSAGFTAQAGIQTGQGIAQSYSQLGKGYQAQGAGLADIYGNTAGGINQAIQGGLQNYYTQQAGGGGGGYFGQFGGVGTGAGSPIYSTPGVL